MAAFENVITKLSYCQLAVNALNGRSGSGFSTFTYCPTPVAHLRRLSLRIHEPEGGVDQMDTPVGDQSAAVVPVVPPLPLTSGLVGLASAQVPGTSPSSGRPAPARPVRPQDCPPPPYCSMTCVTPPSCGRRRGPRRSAASSAAACRPGRCAWSCGRRRSLLAAVSSVAPLHVGFSRYTSLPAAQASIVMLRMPVVGRGNQDRIDVLAVEDAPVVFVAVDLVPSVELSLCTVESSRSLNTSHAATKILLGTWLNEVRT